MKLYEEKQYFKIFIYLMIIPIFAIIIAYSKTKDPLVLTLFSMIFLAILLALFSILKITLDEETLTFGFSFIKSKMNVKDIVSCKPVTIKFSTYLGMGIRYGFDGTKAYNTRFGKAVRIKVKDKKRDYVVTSNKPEELCMILNDQIKKWKTTSKPSKES